ncbi:class I adenylate-forming enzyme family protein [Cellulosilyticum ruminicola]|uniref:class I adenylate-forming enzyme family protein n=1 Tax=Cellulosilyticum ruminicola TaxID=425254 RepID=UPI0006CFFBCE|nr:class I adenylate-forming enzyme family protein [Cellulosilyticum ruminicola]
MKMEENFLRRFEGIKDKQKVLIQVEKETLTYEEFFEQVTQISLKMCYLGIGKGDKIGIMVPNSTVWYSFFWAAVKIGAYPIPIDPQSGIWELEHLIEYTEMKLCIIAPKYRSNKIMSHMQSIKHMKNSLKTVIVWQTNYEIPEEFLSLEEFISLAIEGKTTDYEPDEADILSLACTSGSTGNPKILEVPYKGFYRALIDMSDYLEITCEDIMLLGMPLYHQGGFGMGLQTVLKGGMVIYESEFNPANFLDIIESKKVTIIQLTTTLAKILISRPDIKRRDFSSVRLCYFAGEILTQEIVEYISKELGIRVINIIGSSETATMVIWDSKKDWAVDCNHFRELPFTTAKVVDLNNEEVSIGEIGELVVYTAGVIKGYYKNEIENKNSFCIINGKRYFKTGDMVIRENQQYIRFVGRYKRIIKRGANLVYAEEVEKFLLTHPGIEAVAVVKQIDELLGEAIVAYIQTIANEQISRGEILKFSKGKISAYKVPDKVEVVKEIPHDIGKIQFKYINY